MINKYNHLTINKLHITINLWHLKYYHVRFDCSIGTDNKSHKKCSDVFKVLHISFSVFQDVIYEIPYNVMFILSF